VLGPSQSGKTTGLAIPAILEWQGPVVATSVKSDLVRDTIGARSRNGPAWVFDPTGATGAPASGWSPLAGCGDWQGARRTAAWLCSASRSGGSGIGDEDFWYAAAGKLLAPYLRAAAWAGRDMGQVVRWVNTQEMDEVAVALEDAGEIDAISAAAASWQRDERTRSSVFTTAEMVLEAYADPSVLRSAATSDIGPERLLAGGAPTLYICAPAHEQDRLRPVFATLLQTIVAAAYDRALAAGGALDPPLLIVLDEAANIAPLRDLDAIASTAAGHGIQLVTVWQDLAQLRARYGERAATVVNNHRAKIVLSGISDPTTLDYASKIIGESDVGEASVTTDRRGGRSTTRAVRERRLLTEAELRRLRPQEGVLIYAHLQPARLRLRPWFNDPGLRRRAATRRGSPGSWQSLCRGRTA
jgi:type IV secretion system protein VirD4